MENYTTRGAYSSNRRGGGCGVKFERHWPGGPRQTSWPGRVAKQQLPPRILRQRRANSYCASNSDPLNLRWVAQESLRRQLAGESPMPGDSALNSPVLQANPADAEPAAASSSGTADAAVATVPIAAAPSSSTALSASWRVRRSSAETTANAVPAAAAGTMQYGRQRSMTAMSFKRPQQHRFVPVYGNYRASRHSGLNMDRMQDDRLQLLQPDWYTDKDVLDIGCNDGVFSLKIAETLRVRSMTGVDIDPQLVRAAQANLRRKVQEADEEARLRRQLAMEGFQSAAESASPSTSAAAALTAAASAKVTFPRNVTFVAGNFVPDSEEQLARVEENKYDIIQAFSVTKWIHLNWGDRGLKLFFRRAFRALKPDGKFIVEPQPYHSYRRQLLCAAHKRNYACNIALKPEHFRAYLEQEVGFAHILSISEQQQCHGFQRPVLMCSKPTGYTPAPMRDFQLGLQRRQLPRAESAERLFMDCMAAVSSTTLDTPRSLLLLPASPAEGGAFWEADVIEEVELELEAAVGADEAYMELPVQVG